MSQELRTNLNLIEEIKSLETQLVKIFKPKSPNFNPSDPKSMIDVLINSLLSVSNGKRLRLETIIKENSLISMPFRFSVKTSSKSELYRSIELMRSGFNDVQKSLYKESLDPENQNQIIVEMGGIKLGNIYHPNELSLVLSRFKSGTENLQIRLELEKYKDGFLKEGAINTLVSFLNDLSEDEIQALYYPKVPWPFGNRYKILEKAANSILIRYHEHLALTFAHNIAFDPSSPLKIFEVVFPKISDNPVANETIKIYTELLMSPVNTVKYKIDTAREGIGNLFWFRALHTQQINRFLELFSQHNTKICNIICTEIILTLQEELKKPIIFEDISVSIEDFVIPTVSNIDDQGPFATA